MSEISVIGGSLSDVFSRDETIMTPPMEVQSRQVRVSLYGVDSGDGVDFGSNWSIGHEYTRMLVLKNVITQTIKITYTLPAGKAFVMDFPEVIVLAPGSTKHIPIRFRPIHHTDHFDYIAVATLTSSDKVEEGSFIIPVKANVPKLELFVSPVVDLGFCAMHETSTGTVVLNNTGGTPVYFRIMETVLHTDFLSPIDDSVGQSDMFMPIRLAQTSGFLAPNSPAAEIKFTFNPEYAHAFKFVLKCLVSEQEIPIDSTPDTPGVQVCASIIQAQCVYPYVSLSQTSVDFGPVVATSVLTHTISIRNHTLARTSWSLVDAFAREMSPYKISHTSGVLEPKQVAELKITYFPQVSFQEHNASYHQAQSGRQNHASSLHLLGRSIHIPVKVDRRYVDFGQVTLPSATLPGQPTVAAPIEKSVVTIFNSAAVPAYYSVLITSASAQAPYNSVSKKNGIQNGTVFTVSHTSGEIAPLLSTTTTFYFTPQEPGNYWVRVYILVHQQEPLIIDLLGTAKSSQGQPLPLVHEHIQAYRLRQMLHPALPFVSQQNCLAISVLKPLLHNCITEVLKKVRVYAAESNVAPPLMKQELPHSLRVLLEEPDKEQQPIFPASTKQQFTATSLDPVELSQYIQNVNTGDNQVVVTSRTSYKQLVSQSSNPYVSATPAKFELHGGDSVTVHFSYNRDLPTEILPISLYCAPAHQNSFRLAHTKAMVPPSYVTIGIVNTPTVVDAYTSPITMEPTQFNFGAVQEDAYQTVRLTNTGSSNSLLQIRTSHPNITVLPELCMLRPNAHVVVVIRVRKGQGEEETKLQGKVYIHNGSEESLSLPIVATYPVASVLLPHKILAMPPSVPGSTTSRILKVQNPHMAPVQFRVEGLKEIRVSPRCGVIAPGHYTNLKFGTVASERGTDEIAKIFTSFCKSTPEKALDDVLLTAQQLAVKKGEDFGSGSQSLNSPTNSASSRTFTKSISTGSKFTSTLQESTLRQQQRQGLTKPSDDLGEEHKQLLVRSTGVSSEERFAVNLPNRGTPKLAQEEEAELHVYSRGQQARIEVCSDHFDENGVLLLGAAQIGLACSKTVLFVNTSEVDVHYSLIIKKAQARTNTRPNSAIVNVNTELTVSPAEGVIRAHSSSAVSVSFSPTCIGVAKFEISCIAGQQVLCQLLVECNGNSPTLLVRHVTALLTGANRVLHGTHAWENVQADLINAYLMAPPGAIIRDSSDVALQTLANSVGKEYISSREDTPIPIVPIHFPTFALQRNPIQNTFVMELFNPTQVDCKWTLSPPVDPSHQWDAGQPTHVEMQLHGVTDLELFCASPSQGTLKPGSSVTVLISYIHSKVGFHRLPFILRVGSKAKSIGLLLHGRTELPYPQLLSPLGDNKPMFLVHPLGCNHTTYVKQGILMELLAPAPKQAWPALVFPDQTNITVKTPLVPIQHVITPSTVCTTVVARNKTELEQLDYTKTSDPQHSLIELTKLITTDMNGEIPHGVCVFLNNPTPVPFLITVQPGPLLQHAFDLVTTTIDSTVIYMPPCSSYHQTVRIHSATPMHALNQLTLSYVPIRDQLCALLTHPQGNPALPHNVDLASIVNMPDELLAGMFKPSLIHAGIQPSSATRCYTSNMLLHTLVTSVPLEHHVPISPALAVQLLAPNNTSINQLDQEVENYENFMRSLKARQLPIPHHAEMYEEACTPLPVLSAPSLLSTSSMCLASSYSHISDPVLPCPTVSVSNHLFDIHPIYTHKQDLTVQEEVDPTDVNNFSTVSDIVYLARRVVTITNTSAKTVGITVGSLNVVDFCTIDESFVALDPRLPSVVASPASFTLQPNGETEVVLYIKAGSTPIHYELVVPMTVDPLQATAPDKVAPIVKKPIGVSVQAEADEAEAVKTFCEQKTGVFGCNTSMLDLTIPNSTNGVEPDILKIDETSILRRLPAATFNTQIRLQGWVFEK